MECCLESDQGDALLSLFVVCLWLHKTLKRVSIILMCMFWLSESVYYKCLSPSFRHKKRNTCWRLPSIDVAMPWYSGSFLFFFFFSFPLHSFCLRGGSARKKNSQMVRRQTRA
ncbi:MAG: hypothetical protein JOS17DRAFT_221110 [Linnemannia elongata]|nr:MAG: hypothetical protein JOS17DRAFT_221110 [Linnemannia elongata]